MGSCAVCEEQIDGISGYSCTYCSGSFCSDHRIPEKHDCAGLGGTGAHTTEFTDWQQYDADDGDREASALVAIPVGAAVLAVTVALSLSVGALRLLFSRVGVVALFVVLPAALLGAVGTGALGSEDVAGTPAEPLVQGVEDGFNSGASASGGGIDERRAEQLVLDQINDRRAERDMPPLGWDSQSAGAARSHAEDMAANDYYSHTSQSGETQQQRYSFCDGGENIHKSWVDRRVEMPSGDVVRHHTAEDVASGAVTNWMHSEGHREDGIYGEWWSSAGVGIAVSDSGEVYSVVGFCSR